jgi:aquaporin NIP
MKKYLSEYLGTFILLFVGTGSVIVNQHTNGALGLTGIATVWGFVIIALIYSFGDISGAHFNPAVSIAFAVDNRFTWKEVPAFLLAQLAGALSASFVLHYLFPDNETLAITQPSGTAAQSFILELLMTFILMLVILRVSTGAKEKGITAGIAIGGTVWMLVLFGGPICGTSLNPTRSLAPAIVSGHFNALWIYLTAPFAGTLSAVFVHRILMQEK